MDIHRLIGAVVIGAVSCLHAKEERFDLGELIFDQALWENDLSALVTKEEELDELNAELREQLKKQGISLGKGQGGLQWLSAEKQGLRAGPGYFQLLGEEVGEVVIRGMNSKAANVSISLYNRGDDGVLPLDDFHEDFQSWKQNLSEQLETRPEERKSKGAVKMDGWMWRKGDSAYLLESSINKTDKRAEFIRLRVASLSAAKNKSGKVAKRSSLDDNVKVDDKGFTVIEGVPMVDQGQKGYCVVASIERVGRYYGLEVDQHELAQVANADEYGTAGDDMEKAFQKITGRIHVRTLKLIDYDNRDFEKDVRHYNRAAKKAGVKTFDVDLDRWIVSPVMFWSQAHPETFRDVKAKQNGCDFFQSRIKTYIDQGIPLCWTLFLGMFKEEGLPQSWGGHMRLITGYRFPDGKDGVPEIVYTDSWGDGHARKVMRLDEAFCMTMGLYAMVPNK